MSDDVGHYLAEEFEDPFFSLLVALRQPYISIADYEIVATCHPTTVSILSKLYIANAQQTPSNAANNNTSLFHEFLEDCRLSLLSQIDTVLNMDDVKNEDATVEDLSAVRQWKCTACHFACNEGSVRDAHAACRACRTPRDWEERPLPKSVNVILDPSSNVTEKNVSAQRRTLQVSFPLNSLVNSTHAPSDSSSCLEDARFFFNWSHLIPTFEVWKGEAHATKKKRKRKFLVIHTLAQQILFVDERPTYDELMSLGKGMILEKSFKRYDGRLLYRVERIAPPRDTNATDDVSNHNVAPDAALRLYFFREAKPLDITLDSHEVQERVFGSLTLLHRTNAPTPVLWCPRRCFLESENTVYHICDNQSSSAAKTTSVQLPSSSVESSNNKMSVTMTKVPFEVVRVFTTVFTLQTSPSSSAHHMMPSSEALESLLHIRPRGGGGGGRGGPHAHETNEQPPSPDADARRAQIVVVGIQRCVSLDSTNEVRRRIPEAILGMLGQEEFHLVLNTADSANTFAGIEGLQGNVSSSRSIILMFVKKTVMHKLSLFSCWSERVTHNGDEDEQMDDATNSSMSRTLVSFQYLESTVSVCLVDTALHAPDDVDTFEKNDALRAVLSYHARIRDGGAKEKASKEAHSRRRQRVLARSLPNFDASSDYTIVMGHIGYSSSLRVGGSQSSQSNNVVSFDDELLEEINARHVLTGFQQPCHSEENTAPCDAAEYGPPGHVRILYKSLHPSLRRVQEVAYQYDAALFQEVAGSASASLRMHCLRPYGHAFLDSTAATRRSLFLSPMVIHSDALVLHHEKGGVLTLRVSSPLFGVGVSYSQPLTRQAQVSHQWVSKDAFSALGLVGAAVEWITAHALLIEVVQHPKVGATTSDAAAAAPIKILATALVPIRTAVEESLRVGGAAAEVEGGAMLLRDTAVIGSIHFSVALVA